MNIAMNKWRSAALALAVVMTLGGCASSMSGSAYSRGQARQAAEVWFGVVESVRQVQLEGTQTGTGSLGGAVVGGVAGSTLGGGRGAIIATVLGAVAGSVAGAAIEDNVTRKPGLEITVKLDNGRMLAITQEADEPFRPGERVRVLNSRGVTRVTH